jgi:hypothetical protein
MKTRYSIFVATLLAAGAIAIASQGAVAGYRWDPGCGCQRPIAYDAPQPYVREPAVVYRPRVVYRPQVVYEAVPAYVVRAPVAHGCGCVLRGLFTGCCSAYYGHYGDAYGPGYGGYRYRYGYGPTD